ncbi:MAG: Gfo/Idh/MocA family oxidoreductase [Clostridia bacterium]|nr:Gfo/Idh/MocA family oxidoreductase [Clostridia bacterium]
MENIRIGIMGLNRGKEYVKSYTALEGADVVAVCEKDPALVKAALELVPHPVQVCETYEELLDAGIDAVVLCNYFHEHARVAIAALKKGISVLSETTAAPTLGECVALVEAAEASTGKYMLGANVPVMYGCRELDRLYKGGTFGRVLYAEGEYFHVSEPTSNHYIPEGAEYHWRRYLPRTYYNMHDLGVLMSITGAMPKKVNARAIFAPDVMEKTPKAKRGDVASVILTEMDSGCLFRTTACASLGPTCKWFRLACENGTLETVREDQDSVLYRYNPWSVPEGESLKKTYDARPSARSDAEKNAGHGGSDFLLSKNFLEYLRGEYEPFFDVYRSVALSAAGILAWYSALEDGKPFDIPDFRDRAERAKYADDFRTPFPDENGEGITLACSSKPYGEDQK